VALFKSLGVPNSVFEIGAEEKRKMEELRDDLKKQLTGLPDGAAKSELQKTLAEIEASLVGAAQTADEAALRWVALGEQKIQEIYSKFSHWFEIGQERSQEWFTTHARLITAILGLFAAFALQLDTVEIYKLVSSNRELRDKLVAQTDNVIEQGEKVLKDRPAVLQQAINSMSQVELGTNLSRVAVAPSDTLEMVKARIRENCTNCSPADLEKLLASFDEQTVNVVKTNLAEYSKEYKGMATSLDKSGFELFPKAGWRWEHKESDCWNYFFGSKHTVGMLFSALLLSLGAPFWFNTLKSLASLRSTVAKNIADEEKAEVKSKANQKAANPDQIEKAPATAK